MVKLSPIELRELYLTAEHAFAALRKVVASTPVRAPAGPAAQELRALLECAPFSAGAFVQPVDETSPEGLLLLALRRGAPLAQDVSEAAAVTRWRENRARSYISWFSGIGGFDLALAHVGYECVGACEIDPFARRVYVARFGEPSWFPRDIREVRAEEIPDADLWCGGFPCQDVSVAGKRRGVRAERSGLVFDLLRLAAARKPTWLLLENVPGLLSGRDDKEEDDGDPDGDLRSGDGQMVDAAGRSVSWFGSVLGALADAGYRDIAWRVLDARWFGVPQRRRRVFVLASRDPAGGAGGWSLAAEVLALGAGGGGDPAARGAPGTGAAGGPARGADHAGALCRLGHRGTDDNETGHLVAGPLQAQGEGGRGHRIDAEGAASGCLIEVAPALRAGGRETGPHGSLDGEGLIVAHDTAPAVTASAGHHGHSSPRGDGTDALVVAPPLRNYHRGGLDRTHGEVEALVFKEVESDAGGDPVMLDNYNWTTSTEVPTLRVPPPGDSTGMAAPHIVADLAARSGVVRRLTPTECERLMGLSDGWTCLCGCDPYSTAACRCPDGPRYRALGNAVCVPVVEWIARRLAGLA